MSPNYSLGLVVEVNAYYEAFDDNCDPKDQCDEYLVTLINRGDIQVNLDYFSLSVK